MMEPKNPLTVGLGGPMLFTIFVVVLMVWSSWMRDPFWSRIVAMLAGVVLAVAAAGWVTYFGWVTK